MRAVPATERLAAPDRERLRRLTEDFLAAKTFEAAAGMVITEAIRAEVAIQACLLILNLGLDYYDGWSAIVLYPGDFRVQREYMDENGLVQTVESDLSGEAWDHGPVILSWQTSAQNNGEHSVVLHEFAHKLDLLNGPADGFPPLHPGMPIEDWTAALSSAYQDLCGRVERNLPTPLDPYGASSPGEFFAVASEAFFQSPESLNGHYPAVYGQLSGFYRQDPLGLQNHSRPRLR